MNSIYDNARFKLNTAGLDWRVADLRLVAWGGPPTFTPNLLTVNDKMVEGLTTLLKISDPVVGTAVTATGLAQTDPIIIRTVPIGMPVTHFTMVQYVTSDAMSELLLYIDDAVNLPFTPDGLDLVVQPDWLEGRGWFRP